MAQAAHHRTHLTLNTDGRAHPRENLLAVLTAGFGVVAVIAAFFPSAHVVASWFGIAGLGCGVVSQYVSATTNERWVTVVGLIMSGLGLAFGLAHGGLW